MVVRAFSEFLRRLRDSCGKTKRSLTRPPLSERLEERVLMTVNAAQVADLFPGSDDAFPQELTVVNSALYFTANDGLHGNELWRSDGTAAETVMVLDISPGSAESYPANLTNVNGTLYFTANDGTHGEELWKSDGTAAGTVLVKDIRTGVADSSLAYLTNVNGTLYFRANDGTSGVELWKSDGTQAGTVLIKDINPGAASSSPGELASVNNTLFFTGSDGVAGYELWKSDGTANGTILVKNIFTGTYGTQPNSSYPTNLTNVNGTLFFAAQDASSAYELWKSDGSASGTVLVNDISSPGGSYYLSSLTNVNGTLYFGALDKNGGAELWKSNGTKAGTVRIKDFGGDFSYGVSQITSLNGTVFFSAGDQAGGLELWKSNGTTSGTVLIKNLLPGTVDSYLKFLTNVNGTLYFNADNGTTGRELWSSDGTAAGTVLVTDIQSGQPGSHPSALTNVNGKLFFTARTDTGGRELWTLVEGNDAPTDISLTSTSIAQGNAANATVGTLSAADPNSGNTFTYTLAPGTGSTDNSAFSITGNELRIIPVTSFATQNSYSIRVRVTDQGGLSFEKQFTIKVTSGTVSSGAVITLNSQPLIFHVSGKKIVAIDSSATIASSDESALSFNGATLQVSGHASKDTLSILKQNGISKKGKNVLSGNTVIGTVSGGKKGSALTVRFTAAATQGSVQALLRSVGFKSTDKVSGNRSVNFRITKTGANSNIATRQIQVGP